MADQNRIQLASLTACELAPDGSSATLNLIDREGRPASLVVPLQLLHLLASTLPKIAMQAFRQATGRDGLGLVNSVQSWRIERASDPAYAILTFATPDRFELAFAVRDEELGRMAGLLNEFHLEAFPDGLSLH